MAFVLGDRAVAAARQIALSGEVIKAINEAQNFAEGTGVRLLVKGQRDLAEIRKLSEIKLAN